MKTEKIYYCEKLESTINFLPDKIKFCCDCSEGLGYEIKDKNVFNKKAFLKQRKEYINKLKKGDIPHECKGCINIKEKEVKKENIFKKLVKKGNNKAQIKQIFVNHFKQCDCRCIYCSQEGYYQFEKENYSLVPIIKELYNAGLIDKKNVKVEFQGGNVSLLKEFNKLIEILIDNECKHYSVLTNNIKYLDVLEKIPQENTQIYMVISLDSGTKEKYKEIKQVDAFDKVLENIQRYSQNNKSIKFALKYVIIKDINDNKEDLHNFLETVKPIENIHNITLDIDYRNTFMCKETFFEIPKHWYELFEYAKVYCKENNIELFSIPYVEKVLAEGKAYSIINTSQND